jgi:hypothetical protein
VDISRLSLIVKGNLLDGQENARSAGSGDISLADADAELDFARDDRERDHQGSKLPGRLSDSENGALTCHMSLLKIAFSSNLRSQYCRRIYRDGFEEGLH